MGDPTYAANMDVDLSDEERNLILMALWQLKLSIGKPADDDASEFPAGSGIDEVAYKLGGTPGVVYGLGEPPDSLDGI